MSEDLDEAELLEGSGVGRIVAGVVALVLLLVGGGVAAYVMAEPEMDATKVLVVRMGVVHEHFDEPFVNAFARQLTDHGFDVDTDTTALEPTDEATAIERARTLARETQAATAVLLVVSAERERDGVLVGQSLFRPELVAHVIPTAPDEPVITHRSVFTFEGTSALEVASSVQSTWISTIGPDTIDALYQVEAIREVTERHHDLAMPRMRFVVQLREKVVMVETRRQRVEAFEQHCALSREEARSSVNGEDGVQCVGDPCHPRSVIGWSADGENVIVHEHYREPIIEMLDGGRARWTEPPEAILSLPRSGEGEGRPLLRVGHFYGLATVRPDGRSVAASFFGNDVPAVVTLDPTTGEWQQRWLLSGRERVPREEASADGHAALVYRRRAGWALLGEGEPVIMPTFREAGLVHFPDDEERVVGELETDELAVVGMDGAPEEARTALPGRVRFLLTPRDGQLPLIIQTGRQCSLVSFDLTERILGEPTPLPICFADVEGLADGRLVGSAVWSSNDDAPGDLEIVVVDPSDASVRGLTRNTLRDEIPHVSPDGRSVAFSRRIGEWPANLNLQLYRRVICTAEIPAR